MRLHRYSSSYCAGAYRSCSDWGSAHCRADCRHCLDGYLACARHHFFAHRRTDSGDFGNAGPAYPHQAAQRQLSVGVCLADGRAG